MDNKRIVRRVVGAGLCAALIAGGIAAVSTHRRWTARAYAEEVQAEMVRAYQDSRTWRAQVEERELMDGGKYRRVRHRIDVAGADRYRIESTEADESGAEVCSVTARRGTTIFSSTRAANGAVRVLELRNAPPSLGAAADNILGQRVRDLAHPGKMRYLARDTVRGHTSLKLSVEPGHFVWVDSDSAVPLREQLLSGDTVTHELDVVMFESGSASEGFIPDRKSAASWNVEDLGFRECSAASAPVKVLGFAPRPFAAPKSWTLVSSGYTEATYSEGATSMPMWSELYEMPDGLVLITQTDGRHTQDLGMQDADGTEGPRTTRIYNRTVRYFEDQWRTHASTRCGTVLVSIEALMPSDVTLEMIKYVR
ncbi:MAG: hypothetical protein RBS78_00400 [Coriobacteriia bacterium]|jgi:hypothetical protein|nr:hypothetical protein [Coriobacteriia bacterium]